MLLLSFNFVKANTQHFFVKKQKIKLLLSVSHFKNQKKDINISLNSFVYDYCMIDFVPQLSELFFHKTHLKNNSESCGTFCLPFYH
jgi:hypothetical protein